MSEVEMNLQFTWTFKITVVFTSWLNIEIHRTISISFYRFVHLNFPTNIFRSKLNVNSLKLEWIESEKREKTLRKLFRAKKKVENVGLRLQLPLSALFELKENIFHKFCFSASIAKSLFSPTPACWYFPLVNIAFMMMMKQALKITFSLSKNIKRIFLSTFPNSRI